MLTTIGETTGVDAHYTISNKMVSDAVINGRNEQFYNNIIIDGTKFFIIYKPLMNSDGTCIGMISVGKPTDQVEN